MILGNHIEYEFPAGNAPNQVQLAYADAPDCYPNAVTVLMQKESTGAWASCGQISTGAAGANDNISDFASDQGTSALQRLKMDASACQGICHAYAHPLVRQTVPDFPLVQRS